jgi:hypothetical protein
MSITIFIAVFFSSIVGAQLFGISINKIALLPLEVMLILKNTNGLKFAVSKIQRRLLVWQIFSTFSAFAGIIFVVLYSNQSMGVVKVNLLYIISVLFIYCPIALLLWNSKDKDEYCSMFKRYFIYTARIHALWGFAQFILYYTIKFDLNRFVFEEAFGGMLGGGSKWTALSNLADSGGGILLRVTGLNHDAAFLGMLLIVAFVLESKYIWKYIYIACMIISFSRSAIFTLIAVLVYGTIKSRKVCDIKINLKKMSSFLTTTVIIAIISIIIYENSSYVQIQVARLIERFATIQSGSDGTSRHMGYSRAALSIMISQVPWINKIFGVGVDCGGILFTNYAQAVPWLGLSKAMLNFSYIWAVESDLANTLLGAGFVGFAIYYGFLAYAYFRSKKDINKQKIIFSMVIFGVMYNMSGLTFVQLLYIIVYATKFNMTSSDIEVKNRKVKR